MGLFQKPKKSKRGIKMLVYGGWDVGKTLFTLTFPRNAVIDTEDGSSNYVEHENMALRLVTTSASDVEEALNEIEDTYMDEIDTVTIDSETKIYENLQHAGIVVAEKRARKNKRDTFAEGLSTKEWGKIKLIHKRINSKLISLSALGKNVVVVAQLSDEKEKVGEDYIKVGEKPNGIKGLEYDFDIVLKLCFDKSTGRRYGVIEKDRTSTYKTGQEVDNPSFDHWKHIVSENSKLESNKINLNKDIDQDKTAFEDDVGDYIEQIKEIMRKKIKSKAIDNNFIMSTLAKYSVTSPDDITDADSAKMILEEFANA